MLACEGTSLATAISETAEGCELVAALQAEKKPGAVSLLQRCGKSPSLFCTIREGKIWQFRALAGRREDWYSGSWKLNFKL